MAISSFIPKVWSARLQENFHKALVFGSLCSRNYEGEISQWGDTVHISNLSDITVRPYDPTKDLAEPEALSGTDIVLTIDHGAYYNFLIGDVDAAQARVDLMDGAMRNAAYQLAEDATSSLPSARARARKCPARFRRRTRADCTGCSSASRTRLTSSTSRALSAS